MDKFKIGQIVKVVNHPTCGIRVPFKVDNIQSDGSTFIYCGDNNKYCFKISPKHCELVKDIK
jgi:hypothetical protein